jgi:hypothetical protein
VVKIDDQIICKIKRRLFSLFLSYPWKNLFSIFAEHKWFFFVKQLQEAQSAMVQTPCTKIEENSCFHGIHGNLYGVLPISHK